MMSQSEATELLFVDTFTHANADDINLDLVQFSKVVVVHEVRVIPNAAKINFHNSLIGTKTGSTIPSSFALELYVNNKTANESTFQKLGLFDYKENVEILTKVDSKVPTDVLIIKGWYQSITLAVYGVVSHLETVDYYHNNNNPLVSKGEGKLRDHNQGGNIDHHHHHHSSNQSQTTYLTLATPTPSGHPINSSSSQELVNKYPANNQLFAGGQQQALDINPKSIPLEHVGVTRDPREIAVADGSQKMVEAGMEEGGDDDDAPNRKESYQNLYFDDDNDLGEAEPTDEITDIYGTLSDGEIPETDGDYGQVVPQEGAMQLSLPTETGELPEEWEDEEEEEEAGWMINSLSTFNPCNIHLTPLVTFVDPSLTEYEVEKSRLPSEGTSGGAAGVEEGGNAGMQGEWLRLQQLVEEFKGCKEVERTFEMMDDMLPLLTPALLVRLLHHGGVTDTLVEWCLGNLSIDRLATICDAASLMRNLKLVVRLCGLLCAAADDGATAAMLARGVQHSLLDILTCEHMPPTIRSLVIASLHSSLHTPDGLSTFLEAVDIRDKGEEMDGVVDDEKMDGVVDDVKMDGVVDEIEGNGGERDGEEKKVGGGDLLTPYQRTVRLIATAKRDRCWAGMGRLMKKAHLHELMSLLQQLLRSLVEKVRLLPGLVEDKEEEGSEMEGGKEEEKEKEEDGGGAEDKSALKMNDESERVDGDGEVKKDEEEVKEEVEGEVEGEVGGVVARQLQGVLRKVIQALRQVLDIISQFSPTTNQNDAGRGVAEEVGGVSFTPGDLPFIFRTFKQSKLLEGLLLLLSSPATNNHPTIFHLVSSILSHLHHSPHGLAYLSSSPDTINVIVKVLCVNFECGLGDEKAEGVEGVALNLACHLRTLQLLDQLKQCQLKPPEDNDSTGEASTSLNSLFHLHSLSFVHSGKLAIANVLGMRDNILTLLPYVRNHEENNVVEFNYVLCILACVCRWSGDVRWMVSYGGEILKAVEEGSKLSRCDEQLKELKEWLSPLKSTCPPGKTTNACIQSLASLLDTSTTPSPSSITVLRLLRHFTVEPPLSRVFLDDSKVDSMTYKLLTAELHRCNCLSTFTDVLKKMKEKMMLPWQLGIAQAQSERWMSVTTVKLALTMLRHLVTTLIRARQSQLRDLSCIRPVLTIHSIFCSSLHNGVLPPDLQLIQDLSIGILLSFSRCFSESVASQAAIEKSTWSGMLGELFTFLLSSPCHFLNGSVILSELLPLPLPLQACQAPSKELATEVVLSRQRWSVHLLTHSSSISLLISSLSPTSCQPLTQLLRRVCWQVGDLSTSCALLVTRSLLDLLLEGMSCEQLASDQSQQPVTIKKAVSEGTHKTVAILNLASFLFKQAPLKAAFLSLLMSGDDDDLKYKNVIGHLCDLLNVVSDTPSHLLAQVSIAELLNSLCDASISLFHDDDGDDGDDDDASKEALSLACGLPSPSHLNVIIGSIFAHLAHSEHKFSSALICLKTLASLFAHQYGFGFIKRGSKACSTSAFHSLLSRLNATFSKDSVDCIGTLASTIDCLQMLSSVPSDGVVSMDIGEMRRLVEWPTDQSLITNHPLHDLHALLKEYAKDELALEPVYLNVNRVYELLASEASEDACTSTSQDAAEITLPCSLSLKEQMKRRQLWEVVGGGVGGGEEEEEEEEEDKLTTAYWLSTPVGEDEMEQQEQVRVDLLALCNECLPNFDLQRELRRQCLQSAEQDKNSALVMQGGSTETINTSKFKGANSTFVAPLRGRGFMRGTGMGAGRDVFRSRPPNTSRPPSMHVDDFVKMETHQQHPSIASMPSSALISIPISNMTRKPEEMMRTDYGARDGKMAPATRYLQQFPQRIDDMRTYARMVAGGGRGGGLRGTATGVIRRNYALPMNMNRGDNSMMAASAMLPTSMIERRGVVNTRGVVSNARGGAYQHYSVHPHNMQQAFFEHKDQREYHTSS